jgi:hypothetical protein
MSAISLSHPELAGALQRAAKNDWEHALDCQRLTQNWLGRELTRKNRNQIIINALGKNCNRLPAQNYTLNLIIGKY